MAQRGKTIYLLLFLFVVAPIGAAVIITALLAFHVAPHTVFAPGFALKALVESRGMHVQRQWMVLSTAFCYWALIVIVGTAISSIRRSSKS